MLASFEGILLFGSFEAQLLSGYDVFINTLLEYGIYLGGNILFIGILMLTLSFVLD